MQHTRIYQDPLHIGSITKAMLDTKLDDGRTQLCPRNLLVIGVHYAEGDPKQITAIDTLRFSYNTEKFNPQTDIPLTLAEQNKWQIHGLRDDKDALLRLNRIDTIPLNATHFPYGAEQTGNIANPDFLELIASKLDQTLANPAPEQSRGIQNAFDLQAFNRHVTYAIEYDRALRQEPKHTTNAFKAAATPTNHTNTPQQEKPKGPRLEYVKPRQIRANQKGMGKPKPHKIDKIVSEINARVRANREAAGLEPPRDPGHLNPRAHNTTEKPKQTHTTPAQTPYNWRPPVMASCSAEARIISPRVRPHKKPYVKDTPSGPPFRQERNTKTQQPAFAAASGYTPTLPDTITPAQTILLKIADLLDDSNTAFAQRPCLIKTVYEDKQTGEICGLDVYPYTYDDLDKFNPDYMFSAPNAFNQRIWNGGYIAVQKPVRVSLSERYFHPTSKILAPYNPVIFNDLGAMQNRCAQAGHLMPAYGLQNIPDHWQARPFVAKDITPADQKFADRLYEERQKRQPLLLQTPPTGAIIMRTTNSGRPYPSLIWGAWHNTLTGNLAALECMRIAPQNTRQAEPWHTPVSDQQGTPWLAEQGFIDLYPNMIGFFAAGDETHIISTLDQNAMHDIAKNRQYTLRHIAKRPGFTPHYIPHDWQRTDGHVYDLDLSKLASGAFAPDIKICHTTRGDTRFSALYKHQPYHQPAHAKRFKP